VGRFLNQDSYLGESNEPPSLHRYLYAYSNPTYYTDPTGNAVVVPVPAPVPPPTAGNTPSTDTSTCLQFGCEGNNQLALKTENFLKDAASGFMHLAEMFITKGAGFGNRKEDNTEARITAEGDDLHSTSLPQEDPIPSSTSLEHDNSGLDNNQEIFPANEGPQQGTPGFATDGSQSATSTADTSGSGQVQLPNVMLNKKEGNLKSQGFQDHHVISDKNKLTQDHELLDLAGYDLQKRNNKIFLPSEEGLHPTRSIHKGRHTTKVSRNLAEQMDAITEAGKAAGWSQEQYKQALDGLVSKEREALKTGERALNKNKRKWSE